MKSDIVEGFWLVRLTKGTTEGTSGAKSGVGMIVQMLQQKTTACAHSGGQHGQHIPQGLRTATLIDQPVRVVLIVDVRLQLLPSHSTFTRKPELIPI